MYYTQIRDPRQVISPPVSVLRMRSWDEFTGISPNASEDGPGKFEANRAILRACEILSTNPAQRGHSPNRIKVGELASSLYPDRRTGPPFAAVYNPRVVFTKP